MPEQRLPVLHQADRPLHLPAQCQDLRRAREPLWQRQGPRHPAPRAAQEQGLPSFSAVNWFGVFAPASTSPAVVDKIHDALNKVVKDPKVSEQLKRVAVVPQTSASPKEFAAFVAKENERWGRVARESGASMD